MAQQGGKTTRSTISQIPPTRVALDMLRVEQLLQDFGATGTQLVNGFLESDYNSDLAGMTGLLKYDKMRRSDAQVHASLLCMELPIRSTEWYIEPAKDEEGVVTDEAHEHAELVSRALFEKMEQTWDDTLREILTFLPKGFSVFEKVFTGDATNVWLKKLAFRTQTTIGKWETENGQPGVTQYLPVPVVGGDNNGKSIVSIPANKLLIFSFRREGDNLAGVSVLRSAYKHWYIKDALYKFDSVLHERQSVGIPVITLPDDSTAEDRVLAEAILNRIRANEQSGIVLPSDKWKFAFADLQAGNVSNVWKSIEHHDSMIAKNILAMFMQLASGDGGSRALSEDQSDFFLLSLEAVAKQIDDVVSTFLIKELVDLNFDNVERYPRLAHKRLGSVDYGTMTSALANLTSAGIIETDDDLEGWAREMMDLPPKLEPEEDEEDEDLEDDLLEDVPPEDIEEMEPMDLEPEEEEEMDVLDEAIDDDELEEDERIEAAERYVELVGKQQGFRIVSEETKRKISEALKGRKRGGRIAERRQARLRKAGRTVNDKTEAAAKKRIQDASTGTPKPKSAMKRAISKINMKRKKSKNIGTMKKRQMQTRNLLAKTKPKKQKKASALARAVAKRKAVRVARNKKVKAHEHDSAVTAFDANYHRYAELVDNRFILKLQASADAEARSDLKKKGFVFNDFESEAWRPLTFAERKVNFTSLKKAVDKFGKTLNAQTDDALVRMKDDLLTQVKNAVEKSDIAAVGKIKAKYTGEIAGALTDVQKEMFEIGKQSAAAEMGVKAVATAGEVKGAMRVQNQKLVEALGNDMEAAASKAVTELAAKKGGSITNTGTAEAVAAASAAIDKAVGAAKGTMQTLSVIGSLNMGRTAVFERYPEKVYAMQYSAIIDDRTTDICLSLDGRVVPPGSEDFYKFSPPRHYNCRSIWVEILQDEEFKPDLDAVPSRIPANATIDTFEDLKAPEIKKDSPAIKVLQAELEERKKKLEEYQDAEIFPNRIESHKARIDALEKSIMDAGGSTEMSELKEGSGVPYDFIEHVKEILKADGITFRAPDAE